MGNYGAPDVNSHVPSAALPPHLYLSRLRPSDRESVPLRPLATDYSLLAHTTPAFGKVELLDQLEYAQQLSSSEGLRTYGRYFSESELAPIQTIIQFSTLYLPPSTILY
jgi:hypothetical protein